MKTYYVYIVECSDLSFYTGMTDRLEIRIDQHNDGKGRDAYTFTRRPVELKWYQDFFDVKQAIIWEKKIKGWSRRKKIALIEGSWDDLVLFSKNYTEYGNRIEKG